MKVRHHLGVDGCVCVMNYEFTPIRPSDEPGERQPREVQSRHPAYIISEAQARYLNVHRHYLLSRNSILCVSTVASIMQYHHMIIMGAVLFCFITASPISETIELSHSADWTWAKGTDPKCTKFVVPEAGDYCDKVAKSAGIATKWFVEQNPQIDDVCGNLWTNTKYCVAPPSGQPGKDTPTDVEDAGKKEAENEESNNKDTGIVNPGNEAGVVLHNKSPSTVCFAFEAGAGISDSNLPTSASCQIGPDSFHAIIVPSRESRFHHFLPGFHGAINVVTNGVRGARHEITFVSGNPPGAFYDVDYEFGLSSSTFGPFDGRPRLDGGDSLVGEADILTKTNQQFKKLSAGEKKALVSASGEKYIKQGPSGDLTWVCFSFVYLPSQCLFRFTSSMTPWLNHVLPRSFPVMPSFHVIALMLITRHRLNPTRKVPTRCGTSSNA